MAVRCYDRLSAARANVLFVHGRGCSIEIVVARSLWQRTRGLLGRPAPRPGAGMLIERCSVIHTVGMGYAIDAVFLDANYIVTRIVTAPRFRLVVWGGWGAKHTLELAAGEGARLGLLVGDRVGMVPRRPG